MEKISERSFRTCKKYVLYNMFMEWKNRAEQVLILTAIFVLIDLVKALLTGGISEVISLFGLFLIIYNFAWALGIELMFMIVGTLLRKVVF